MSDYVIVAVDGPRYLLAADGDDPRTQARVWDGETLFDARPIGQWLKFGLYEEYAGPQDALAAAVPERIFTGPRQNEPRTPV